MTAGTVRIVVVHDGGGRPDCVHEVVGGWPVPADPQSVEAWPIGTCVRCGALVADVPQGRAEQVLVALRDRFGRNGGVVTVEGER